VQAEHDAAEEARHAARQAAQRRSALDVQRALARQVPHRAMRSKHCRGVSCAALALGHGRGSIHPRPLAGLSLCLAVALAACAAFAEELQAPDVELALHALWELKSVAAAMHALHGAGMAGCWSGADGAPCGSGGGAPRGQGGAAGGQAAPGAAAAGAFHKLTVQQFDLVSLPTHGVLCLLCMRVRHFVRARTALHWHKALGVSLAPIVAVPASLSARPAGAAGGGQGAAGAAGCGCAR
jgi:hypothetical protein